MSRGNSTLVPSVALSTALMPFTPVAPPVDVLIVLQPGPSGWQLTDGGAGSEVRMARGAAPGRAGDSMVFGRRSADLAAALEAPREETEAVDGEAKGPNSSEQPAEAQPVAAGPTKVGLNCPRLDDLTALAVLAAGAAVARVGTVTRAMISESSDSIDSRVAFRRMALSLVGRTPAPPTTAGFPPEGPSQGARISKGGMCLSCAQVSEFSSIESKIDAKI